ncbi:hypothetical protein LAWI1_G007275 [Lachnellula willkommii]|uniref:Heterokaryon incompatibility domain-containing protein n=1 Tax=Lachnellula willkommii TaxID=215461 RepID=A0A559M471_9HELO|nr:hypothetical protein LAWI1_G007275 [Lachnellula willkommii]
MGWIYSAATSVLIVLQPSIWHIIASVSAEKSPRALTYAEMQILEQDTWINRVWTYQELVNADAVYFTTLELEPAGAGHAMRADRFFNCVGFSLETWKRATGQGHIAVLETFHNLDTLQDTLADRQLGEYLHRTAFGVLSNMALRKFDAAFPQNRLLASLGALSQDVSWGPLSTTLAELAEKLMAICEAKGDYSFVYTSDVRETLPGRRWRPGPSQITASEPVNLVPVANWSNWGAQNGHRDSKGFWLDEMVQLKPADRIDEEVENVLDKILYGSPALEQPGVVTHGIFRRKEGEEEELSRVMLRFLRKIGFKGYGEPLVCKQGLFFSQLGLESCESVEIYAASSLRWRFGSPGLATWKENGESRYCAGVFVGVSTTEVPQSILLG